MKNFWRSQNAETISDKIVHLSASTALAGAAIAMAPPTIAAYCFTFAAFYNGLQLHSSKKHFENNLRAHPESHRFSPNLQNMVDALFRKSGLNQHKAVIYNFDAENEEDQKKDKKKKKREQVGEILGVPNAAAFSMGKPVIMASDALLQILNDREEYAVLAHEFAHVMGKHVHLILLGQVAMTGASLASQASKAVEWIEAGNASMIASTAAYTAMVSSVIKIGHCLSKDAPKSEKDSRKLKTYATAHLCGSLASAGITTIFNPAYPVIYAAAQGISYGSVLLNKSLSRSFEYQCDRNAVTLLDADPLALITSLRKITAIQQQEQERKTGKTANPSLTSRWQEIHSTHPATHKRIERLAELASQKGISDIDIEEALTGELEALDTRNIKPHVLWRTSRRLTGSKTINVPANS